MKKTIGILLILFCCLVSGCGREILKEKDISTGSEQVTTANEEYEVVASEQSNIAEAEDKIDGSEQSMAENRTEEFVRNPYFYDKKAMFFLQAKAKL